MKPSQAGMTQLVETMAEPVPGSKPLELISVDKLRNDLKGKGLLRKARQGSSGLPRSLLDVLLGRRLAPNGVYQARAASISKLDAFYKAANQEFDLLAVRADEEQSAWHDKYLRRLSDEIRAATPDALDAVRRADCKPVSEEDFLGRLTNTIVRLQEGDRLYALCGKKNYAAESVYQYLHEFVRAAALRKVRVRRHYVALGTSQRTRPHFSNDEWRIVYTHLKCHLHLPEFFHVSVLYGTDGEKFWVKTGIPKYAGVVLVDRRIDSRQRERLVYMHKGFEQMDAQDCCSIESNRLVFEWLRSIMDDIASEAELDGMKSVVNIALEKARKRLKLPKSLRKGLGESLALARQSSGSRRSARSTS